MAPISGVSLHRKTCEKSSIRLRLMAFCVFRRLCHRSRLCRSAKRRDEPDKLSDAGGLQLWVHTSGPRTWRIARCFDGKQKVLSPGQWPELSLAEARDLRDDNKRLIRKGGRLIAYQWYACGPLGRATSQAD
jgi:hypothetical protein